MKTTNITIAIDPTTLKIQGSELRIEDYINAGFDRLLPRLVREIMTLGVDATAEEISDISEEVFERFLPILREDVTFAVTHNHNIEYAISDIFDRKAGLLCSIISKIGNVDLDHGEIKVYATLIFGRLFNDIRNIVEDLLLFKR